MQGITRRLLNIALFFVAVLLLISCATGPAYRRVDKIPEGMGVVYIYSKKQIAGYLDIEANGVTIITKLIVNGYYPYFLKPGEVEFAASAIGVPKSAVTLYIEAGQTYYLRGNIVTGPFFIGLPFLTSVPPKIGEEEIADCKLQEGRQPALEGKMGKAEASTFTPEEILLLKRSGVSDEKILEMQKKRGETASA